MSKILECVIGEQDPNVVNKGTWGHYAPKKGKVYNGVILFTYTAWGCTEMIDFTFVDDAQNMVEGGPWLYNEVYDLVCEMTHHQRGTLRDTGVYQWRGTYKCKGFNKEDVWIGGEFSGQTEKIV